MKKSITVENLVKMELEYIEKQKDVPSIIDEFAGLVPANHNDMLFFFMKKHIFTQERNLTNQLKHELSRWQLTKFEMLMLLCYQGDLYDVFDKGDPMTSQYPINEKCKAMDSVLIKAPSCTEVPIVYRQHKSNNVWEFKKGEICFFESYLTASIKKSNQHRHQLIITLNKDNTNAKSLYIIRNDKNEFQVTFKRGTSFYIENIESFYDDDEQFRRIWMKEL